MRGGRLPSHAACASAGPSCGLCNFTQLPCFDYWEELASYGAEIFRRGLAAHSRVATLEHGGALGEAALQEGNAETQAEEAGPVCTLQSLEPLLAGLALSGIT